MMEICQVQYEPIADCFPAHRGNVTDDHLNVLNAILYVLEMGANGGGSRKGSETGILSTCA